MSHRHLSPVIYIFVLLILMALTLLTVGLSFVPSSPLTRIVAGQSIAVVKATFVVLFFMHALGSQAQTKAVILVSVFWLMVLLFGLTLTDYFTRGLVPNLPGH
jgi:caa(3)-type oxidase subunit IV